MRCALTTILASATQREATASLACALATTQKAKKVRVTGYLLWDDDHNGSADVDPSVEYFSKNGFHHPWRSTAWEIHPIMKIEVLE
jgi:hypothetical protein